MCLFIIFIFKAYMCILLTASGLHEQYEYYYCLNFTDVSFSGWRKHGKKCYKVFIQHVSWEDANKVCKRYLTVDKSGTLEKLQIKIVLTLTEDGCQV